jgi:hypothetical protein
MGSLADLIVATSSDAEAIVGSEYPLSSFKGVNVDGLDPLQIAALHSVVADKAFEELLGSYEPPEELISTLASISPDNQALIANQWAASNQLQEAGWSEQEAIGFLAQLIHFAQVVSFENLELFLCAYD